MLFNFIDVQFKLLLLEGMLFFFKVILHEISLGLFNFISTILPKITLFVSIVNPNLFYSCLLGVDFFYELSKCPRNKVILAMFWINVSVILFETK